MLKFTFMNFKFGAYSFYNSSILSRCCLKFTDHFPDSSELFEVKVVILVW